MGGPGDIGHGSGGGVLPTAPGGDDHRGRLGWTTSSVLAIGLLMLVAVSASADDVPIATPKTDDAASSERPCVTSLADTMVLMRIRYADAWRAGRDRNWRLASLEIERIKDSLVRAAMNDEAMPVAQVRAITQPLASLARAARRADATSFTRSFARLTAACNGCHQAAGIGFVAVRSPARAGFQSEEE